jgi:phosphatidylserine decarboxylase
MIKIHKEGYGIFTFLTLLLFVIAIVAAIFLFNMKWILLLVIIFLSLCILFVARFFRIPSRKTIFQEGIIYSPADGKIVVIEETFENEFLNETRIQVSIFMSVWDVHINFYPFHGKVIHYKHHPGRYLIARHPKSSVLNERTTIVIENDNKVKILLRQIAGIIARRIVCYAKPGLSFKTGDELGFIKFGSRVDIFLPKESNILVQVGEQVYGSASPIARF